MCYSSFCPSVLFLLLSTTTDLQITDYPDVMLPSYAEALSCRSVGKRREIVGTNWFSNKVYLRRSPVAFLVLNDGAEISASIGSTLTKQLFKWKNLDFI